MGMFFASSHVLSVHAHYSLYTKQGAKLRLFLLSAKYFLMFFFLLLFFLLSQIYCPNCGSRFGHSLPAS